MGNYTRVFAHLQQIDLVVNLSITHCLPTFAALKAASPP